MSVSDHTRLINYMIGLCKKGDRWPTVLADHGYEVQLIEQQMTCAGTGETVKPDLVVVCNKYLHCLVCECKGGHDMDTEQVNRYLGLRPVDLVRWITVYSSTGLRHDICYCVFPRATGTHVPFPVLTFTRKEIVKSNSFGVRELNQAFASPISLENKVPPLFYYPFSAEDDDEYVTPFVLRGLVATAIRAGRGGPSTETYLEIDKMNMQTFNPVWKALSKGHQTELRAKVHKILQRLIQTELKGILDALESRRVKMTQPLESLTAKVDDIIRSVSRQAPLTEYMS